MLSGGPRGGASRAAAMSLGGRSTRASWTESRLLPFCRCAAPNAQVRQGGWRAGWARTAIPGQPGHVSQGHVHGGAVAAPSASPSPCAHGRRGWKRISYPEAIELVAGRIQESEKIGDRPGTQALTAPCGTAGSELAALMTLRFAAACMSSPPARSASAAPRTPWA
jgi:anaerobic selenocysteine-containing dehydrogenase